MPLLRPQKPPEGGLPPGEVKITGLRVEPWPDGRRVRVNVTFTPFLERPNVHFIIQDENGHEVTSLDIIENMDAELAFTMHIRGEIISGRYILIASIQYPDLGTVCEERVAFETSEHPD